MKDGNIITITITDDLDRDFDYKVIFKRFIDEDTIEYKYNGKLYQTHYKSIKV